MPNQTERYGWNTEQGFVRDPRKLVAIYFANPNYREEHGGTWVRNSSQRASKVSGLWCVGFGKGLGCDLSPPVRMGFSLLLFYELVMGFFTLIPLLASATGRFLGFRFGGLGFGVQGLGR